MKNKEELIKEISSIVLLEIIFTEKKNFNTKEQTDSEMIKTIKRIVEREVKKHDIQKN
jgi:hypothetical protein